MIWTFLLSKLNCKTYRNDTKILAICLFLANDFASCDDCNIKVGNLANLVPKFDNK
jgi:hypothetical protein